MRDVRHSHRGGARAGQVQLITLSAGELAAAAAAPAPVDAAGAARGTAAAAAVAAQRVSLFEVLQVDRRRSAVQHVTPRDAHATPTPARAHRRRRT
jgi:hypothetical protein